MWKDSHEPLVGGCTVMGVFVVNCQLLPFGHLDRDENKPLGIFCKDLFKRPGRKPLYQAREYNLVQHCLLPVQFLQKMVKTGLWDFFCAGLNSNLYILNLIKDQSIILGKYSVVQIKQFFPVINLRQVKSCLGEINHNSVCRAAPGYIRVC